MCAVVSKQYLFGFVLVASMGAGRVATANAPKVVEMFPAHGATDVDPTINELRVVFDRDMKTGEFSFCGGGPTFPKSAGRTGWADKRTIVMKVKLKPDHKYRMSLNCPAAQNFRSASGVALKPVPWSFRTASKPKTGGSGDQQEQSGVPRIVKITPANGATDVDPTIRELRVVFDRDMRTGGYSFCGGGPAFPEMVERTGWVDKRTIVMKVKLQPDHKYRMSLNCPGAQNFRSEIGVALEPVPWSFKTASKPKTGGAGDQHGRSSAPRIVEITPANGATDVDPATRELRVVFDRDMSTSGYSFCGGGPTFPESAGQTGWADKRTIVMKVKLEADHDYRLSLNCRSGQNFRSADRVPLEPVSWNFSTAPNVRSLTAAQQKELNTRCFAQLLAVLRDHYSYYDLRDIDWSALEQKHREKIIGAASTRGWIKETATMLSQAEDMHLWLTYRGNPTPTHMREIKRNYDMEGLKSTLPSLRQRNSCVYTARTDDNIGYIMITTLSRNQTGQLERVQDYLVELANCKALMVDLRANGGGAEPLAYPIAAWFVTDTKTYAMHVTRDPQAKGGFTKPYERTITGNTGARRFDKPVAVLSGPGVMSSAEAFLLMLRQGKHVTVIGKSTYGSSGNPKSHSLENGVEVFVPSWQAMRPNGTCFEGEGIKPDVNVRTRASLLKERDPVIERALKQLRKMTE